MWGRHLRTRSQRRQVRTATQDEEPEATCQDGISGRGAGGDMSGRHNISMQKTGLIFDKLKYITCFRFIFTPPNSPFILPNEVIS